MPLQRRKGLLRPYRIMSGTVWVGLSETVWVGLSGTVWVGPSGIAWVRPSGSEHCLRAPRSGQGTNSKGGRQSAKRLSAGQT